MNQTSCFITLTLVLGTHFLLTAHCLIIFVSRYIKIPATNIGLLDQTSCFFTFLTLNFDLGPSNTVFPHCIKFLSLMKELWTGYAFLTHLTLNCDLNLEHSQMVLVHCIAHYGNAHAYQVLSHSGVR